MKNDESETYELSSSYSRRVPHEQENPSRRDMGSEQAAKHGETQTYHEAELVSHKSNEAQMKPSNPCMIGKW
jgi:hypothetical protein